MLGQSAGSQINIIDTADCGRSENLADIRQPATCEALPKPVRTADHPGSSGLPPYLGERRRQAGQLIGHQRHPAALVLGLCEQADTARVEEDHRRPTFGGRVRRPARLVTDVAAEVEQRVPHRAQGQI